jgi:SAM-dependent methyltransferase
MPLPRVHGERHRAESFGSVAAQYDRIRPSYPLALIDDLVAGNPHDVLDIGCGTGKAGRLFLERGLSVLGVEVDPQMADVARGYGMVVERASFETWDARGRQFDLIVCGQAWHWVEPAAGSAKVAALLRPGATFAPFWNVNELDAPVQAALDAVYHRLAPALARPVMDHKATDAPYAVDIERTGLFDQVVEREYRWERTYTRDEWLALIQTHSDHVVLPPGQRTALVSGVGAVIDQLGGRVVAHYCTQALFARLRSR